MVGGVRASVWMGLEDEGDRENARCIKAVWLCIWFLLRGSALSSASQKPVVRQLFWQVQYDWHPSSVSGITGASVVVSVSLYGGIDLYSCGQGNNFQSLATHRWMQSCVYTPAGGRRRQRLMLRRAAFSFVRRMATLLFVAPTMNLRKKTPFSFSALNHRDIS